MEKKNKTKPTSKSNLYEEIIYRATVKKKEKKTGVGI